MTDDEPQDQDVDIAPVIHVSPGVLDENSLALVNLDFEGEWPWPHFPAGKTREFIDAYGHQGPRYIGWEGDFLNGFRTTGIIRTACAYAKINPALVLHRRKDDPAFNQACVEAKELATDAIEAEAWRRAMQGVKRTRYIYYKGKQLTTEEYIEYDTKLLVMLLEANRPEKYRHQSDPHHALLALQERARQIAVERGYTPEQIEAVVAEATRLHQRGHS